LHQVFAPDLAILAQEKAFVNSKFRFYLKKAKISAAAPERRQTLRPLPRCDIYYKGTIKW
jgi:hypothetical protein